MIPKNFNVADCFVSSLLILKELTYLLIFFVYRHRGPVDFMQLRLLERGHEQRELCPLCLHLQLLRPRLILHLLLQPDCHGCGQARESTQGTGQENEC